VEEVFSAYRRHPIFRQLDNDQLRLVIQGLVQSAEGQVKLKYSPTWEARVYAAAVWNDGDLWRGLPGLAVPTLIIRGSHSDTLTQEACSLAEAANPRIQTATIERATHLMPFEQPSQVHFLALQYLRLVLDGSARDGLSELRNAPEQSWIAMP
jgi:pimeloyl-ACP methyl ester carboxylesterase